MLSQNKIGQLSLVLLMAGLICSFGSKTVAAEGDPNGSYFEMSLEELMNVEISGSGSLTKTTRRKVPATMTTITQEDIRRTGARNLDDLLLITVPNIQKQFHRNEYEHMGIRGIIGDVDDKYLLLVNGRLMNERYYYGALAERDLPMLSDIHHIEVIRGPGSALYGPGAIGMVINIITESGLTFEGLETTGRMGMIEEFYSGEMKYGRRFSDDHGVFLYTGYSKYPGADGGDASRVYSQSSVEKLYDTTAGGNRAFRGKPKVKIYGQYDRGGFTAWARYTQGGRYRYPFLQYMGHEAGDGYQKLTLYTSYRYEISPALALTPSFSVDIQDRDERYHNSDFSSWRRDEYNTKLVLDWTPNDRHQVTVGGEWAYTVNNLRGIGEPDVPSRFWSSRSFGKEP
ncbi:MAG: TonB-dependent receptor plug domain-containing protein, partial [Phycisphaerae bacterium]|nr:TonB-dependent receptor plug domain-containing protein [Phycisphaerae bacterium]